MNQLDLDAWAGTRAFPASIRYFAGRDHMSSARATVPATEPVLEARSLFSGYGGVAAVRDLNLRVNRGEVVGLLGPNGSGKTTTLLTLCGEVAPISGEVRFLGSTRQASLAQRSRQGLALVTEERSVFMGLTVAENLRLGRGEPEVALEAFPMLREHLHRKAGLLWRTGTDPHARSSAGLRTSALLADELSLGLAPIVVQQLLRAIRSAADEQGVGVLLVEQHVRSALQVADRIYILQRGRCVLDGTATEMLSRLDEIESSYLDGPVEVDS